MKKSKKTYKLINSLKRNDYLEKLKEDKLAKTKRNILFILGILIISLICFAVAEVVITQISPVGNITTSNSSQVISYNISTDYLNNLTFNWDNANYSLYDDSLVLFMNFDNRSALGENDTHVKDLSKYGNNGTVVGGSNISWTPNGKYGGAFKTDETIGNISINYNLLGYNYSISFWIKTYNTSSLYFLGSNYMGARFQSNKIAYYVNNNSWYAVSMNDVMNTNQWYFITLNNLNGNISIYQDSILKNSLNVINPKNNTNFYLFNAPISVGNTNLTIDDLIIYNRSLSSNEINNLYQSSLTKYDSQNWNFTTNQSLNANINSTNPTHNFPYYICSSNSSGSENCTNQKTITQIIPTKTLTANFTTNIGNINRNMYGTNIRRWVTQGSTLIDLDGNGVVETTSDLNWHRQTLDNGNINFVREDSSIDALYTNNTAGTYNFTGNFTPHSYFINYSLSKGYKILYLIQTVPTSLKDTSSGFCNSTSLRSCPPSNYSLYADMVLDFVNRTTSNGLYSDSIYFSIWNEPEYQISWCNNLSLTNINRSVEYNKLYNATYLKIKLVYPNVQVGSAGFSGNPSVSTAPILNGFLSNFSNQTDFIEFHQYDYSSTTNFDDVIVDRYDSLIGNISLYGGNVSRIIFGEEGYAVSNLQNNLSRQKEYGAKYSLLFVGVLNNFPTNVSIIQYQWSERYNASKSFYPEYPSIWSMVSEAGLDNPTPTYYPPYNVTKNFAHLCPAGGTVYQSSSDDDTIKTVSCKKGNQRSLIVINTDTSSKNVSVNLTNSGITNIYNDLNHSETFIASGSTNLGIIDSYDILYLTEYLQSPTLTINSPLPQTYTNNLIDLNITLDEEGDTCYSSDNGGANQTMTKQGVVTQFKSQVSFADGSHNVVFSCNDTSGNWGNNNVNFVARYILPTDEAGKFWDDFFNAFAAKTTMTFLFLIIMIGVLLIVIFKIKLGNQTAHV